VPTRNVNLTDELDRFVAAKIDSGRFENASEVIRAALRGMEREEQEDAVRLEALREAIVIGDASGPVKGNPFTRLRKKLKLPHKR
jgi:antitoxin ParD1/3/4